MTRAARQLLSELASGLTLDHGIWRGRRCWHVADQSDGHQVSTRTIRQITDAGWRLVQADTVGLSWELAPDQRKSARRSMIPADGRGPDSLRVV